MKNCTHQLNIKECLNDWRYQHFQWEICMLCLCFTPINSIARNIPPPVLNLLNFSGEIAGNLCNICYQEINTFLGTWCLRKIICFNSKANILIVLFPREIAAQTSHQWIYQHLLDLFIYKSCGCDGGVYGSQPFIKESDVPQAKDKDKAIFRRILHKAECLKKFTEKSKWCKIRPSSFTTSIGCKININGQKTKSGCFL